MATETLPANETEELKSKFGVITITKQLQPSGFVLSFKPAASENGYRVELGGSDTGEAEEMEFLQTFKMAGAPFDFVCMNTDQQKVMDALKELCIGTRIEYVIQKLKSIPR